MSGEIELPPVADQFFEATVKEDVELLVGCFAKGFDVCWFPGSPDWFVHGVGDLEKAWTDWFASPPMHFTSWKWLQGPFGEQSGDLMWSWGILDATYDTTEDPPRKDVHQNKRVSWIFRREDGEWRLAAEHWSRPRLDDYLTPDDPETIKFRPYGED